MTQDVDFPHFPILNLLAHNSPSLDPHSFFLSCVNFHDRGLSLFDCLFPPCTSFMRLWWNTKNHGHFSLASVFVFDKFQGFGYSDSCWTRIEHLLVQHMCLTCIEHLLSCPILLIFFYENNFH